MKATMLSWDGPKVAFIYLEYMKVAFMYLGAGRHGRKPRERRGWRQ
jgi:hypothetical protein